MAKKSNAKKTTEPEVEDCAFCGEAMTMGGALCGKCGEYKCVDQCIPGGVGTICVECEEAQDA